ncbi:MAG: hypothetical protein CVV42_06140 [Candidatus Riflebacteria bacterium HGW-Riflebacteria-2]|nr:MAG: hypothetical protein CVV42_06140 [Candidatus Riflebacteria bacterium HGW-Riflebacteria-2]
MRRFFLSISCLFIFSCLFYGNESIAADNQINSGRPGLGEFASFAQHLEAARNANRAGRQEEEQSALQAARRSLDNVKMESPHALIKQDFQNILVKDTFNRIHGAPSDQLRGLYFGLECGTKGGLYEHLDEAIRSHESRMPYYSERSGGASDPLFRKIATLQRLNLPVAWYIDLQARRFQKAGIPIITGDLFSMSTIYPKDRPPRYTGIMSDEALKAVRLKVREFQQKAFRHVSKSEFYKVAEATHELVVSLRQLEKQHNAHLAMMVHMLDSVGYTALHAAGYQQKTCGATDNLARQFLTIQIFPLQECLPTDRMAQALHARGIGVIVNDVPDILFLKEWETWQAQQR